jgi:hypothetical protein
MTSLKNLEGIWEVTPAQQKRELAKLDRSLSYEETLTVKRMRSEKENQKAEAKGKKDLE